MDMCRSILDVSKSLMVGFKAFALTVVVVCLASQQVRAEEYPVASSLQKECGEKWAELAKRFGTNFSSLESAWRNQKTKCEGTGVYEYRLAELVAKTAGADQAMDLLRKAIAQDLPRRDVMQELYEEYRFVAAGTHNPIDVAEINSAVSALEQQVKNHPKLETGWLWLSLEHIYQRRYEMAKGEAETLLSMDPQSMAGHRNLAIAAAYLKNYSVAMTEIDKAIEINPGLKGDHDFMLAVARYYLDTGNRAAAKDVLDEYLKRNPGMVNDEDFVARRNELKP